MSYIKNHLGNQHRRNHNPQGVTPPRNSNSSNNLSNGNAAQGSNGRQGRTPNRSNRRNSQNGSVPGRDRARQPNNMRSSLSIIEEEWQLTPWVSEVEKLFQNQSDMSGNPNLLHKFYGNDSMFVFYFHERPFPHLVKILKRWEVLTDNFELVKTVPANAVADGIPSDDIKVVSIVLTGTLEEKLYNWFKITNFCSLYLDYFSAWGALECAPIVAEGWTMSGDSGFHRQRWRLVLPGPRKFVDFVAGHAERYASYQAQGDPKTIMATFKKKLLQSNKVKKNADGRIPFLHPSLIPGYRHQFFHISNIKNKYQESTTAQQKWMKKMKKDGEHVVFSTRYNPYDNTGRCYDDFMVRNEVQQVGRPHPKIAILAQKDRFTLTPEQLEDKIWKERFTEAQKPTTLEDLKRLQGGLTDACSLEADILSLRTTFNQDRYDMNAEIEAVRNLNIEVQTKLQEIEATTEKLGKIQHWQAEAQVVAGARIHHTSVLLNALIQSMLDTSLQEDEKRRLQQSILAQSCKVSMTDLHNAAVRTIETNNAVKFKRPLAVLDVEDLNVSNPLLPLASGGPAVVADKYVTQMGPNDATPTHCFSFEDLTTHQVQTRLDNAALNRFVLYAFAQKFTLNVLPTPLFNFSFYFAHKNTKNYTSYPNYNFMVTRFKNSNRLNQSINDLTEPIIGGPQMESTSTAARTFNRSSNSDIGINDSQEEFSSAVSTPIKTVKEGQVSQLERPRANAFLNSLPKPQFTPKKAKTNSTIESQVRSPIGQPQITGYLVKLQKSLINNIWGNKSKADPKEAQSSLSLREELNSTIASQSTDDSLIIGDAQDVPQGRMDSVTFIPDELQDVDYLRLSPERLQRIEQFPHKTSATITDDIQMIALPDPVLYTDPEYLGGGPGVAEWFKLHSSYQLFLPKNQFLFNIVKEGPNPEILAKKLPVKKLIQSGDDYTTFPSYAPFNVDDLSSTISERFLQEGGRVRITARTTLGIWRNMVIFHTHQTLAACLVLFRLTLGSVYNTDDRVELHDIMERLWKLLQDKQQKHFWTNARKQLTTTIQWDYLLPRISEPLFKKVEKIFVAAKIKVKILHLKDLKTELRVIEENWGTNPEPPAALVKHLNHIPYVNIFLSEVTALNTHLINTIATLGSTMFFLFAFPYLCRVYASIFVLYMPYQLSWKLLYPASIVLLAGELITQNVTNPILIHTLLSYLNTHLQFFLPPFYMITTCSALFKTYKDVLIHSSTQSFCTIESTEQERVIINVYDNMGDNLTWQVAENAIDTISQNNQDIQIIEEPRMVINTSDTLIHIGNKAFDTFDTNLDEFTQYIVDNVRTLDYYTGELRVDTLLDKPLFPKKTIKPKHQIFENRQHKSLQNGFLLRLKDKTIRIPPTPVITNYPDCSLLPQFQIIYVNLNKPMHQLELLFHHFPSAAIFCICELDDDPRLYKNNLRMPSHFSIIHHKPVKYTDANNIELTRIYSGIIYNNKIFDSVTPLVTKAPFSMATFKIEKFTVNICTFYRPNKNSVKLKYLKMNNTSDFLFEFDKIIQMQLLHPSIICGDLNAVLKRPRTNGTEKQFVTELKAKFAAYKDIVDGKPTFIRRYASSKIKHHIHWTIKRALAF